MSSLWLVSTTSFFNFSFLPKYTVYFAQGILYTLLLSVVAVALAVLPALGLALMRLSKNKLLKGFSGAYIALFRSTPLLVQLALIYYGLFGVAGIQLPSIYVLGYINLAQFVPGAVALALNSAAYVAEIFRGGILAVDKGQTEAARSLGLTQWQAMKFVVLPQAIKNILPALANEVTFWNFNFNHSHASSHRYFSFSHLTHFLSLKISLVSNKLLDISHYFSIILYDLQIQPPYHYLKQQFYLPLG